MSKGYLLQLICPQNVGYVFGSSTRGQRSLYDTGLTGIPITNCNNNCSTGSTALFLSRNLVAGGMADCALALGFEKMQKGSLAVDDDDVNPLGAWIYMCICCMKPSSTCVCIYMYMQGLFQEGGRRGAFAPPSPRQLAFPIFNMRLPPPLGFGFAPS